MIRVNHYGSAATPGVVRSCLTALGAAMAESGLTVDLEAAHRAATEAWA
jgi:aspartate aminotransferase-like enzyme